MPRRARISKRREADPLDVACALANADVLGCAAIPEDVTTDDLLRLHLRVRPRRSRESWGHLAFDAEHPRPCEALERFDPFEERTESAGLTCGDRCRFADREVRA